MAELDATLISTILDGRIIQIFEFPMLPGQQQQDQWSSTFLPCRETSSSSRSTASSSEMPPVLLQTESIFCNSHGLRAGTEKLQRLLKGKDLRAIVRLV